MSEGRGGATPRKPPRPRPKPGQAGRRGTTQSASNGRRRSSTQGGPAKKQARKPVAKQARKPAQAKQARKPVAKQSAKRQPSSRARRPATRERPPPSRPPRPKPKRSKRPRRFQLADPRKRLKVSLIGVGLVLSLFTGRLVQLQGLDASTYAASASLIGRDTTAITADRGDIVDRDGEPLASTVEAFNITVDQTQVTNPAAYALQLEDLLGMEAGEIQQALTGTDRFGYVAKGVSGATWREVEALDLPGLYAEPAPARTYPAGSVGGNVVGFIGSDGTGLAGLEQSQEATLAGEDGEATYNYSPGGQRIPTSSGNEVDPPVPGTGLRLTLDRDLQWYTEQVLAAAVADAGADSGVATVMTTDTQEILAMASTPVVDPNDPGKTPAEDRGNKAVEYAYEPGSIFKPLTMAAVIEEGGADPETVFSVPDQIDRGGKTIHDYYDHPEQEMTLTEILAKSSNVGTVLASETIESDAFRGYLEDFGLGSKPGLGMPAETGGILPEDWSGLTHDNIAFGQGVAVSSVQMASAYATIANGGVRSDPTLISATVDADGEETPTSPGESTRVVSEETAAQVTTMMEAVMGPEGTGEQGLVDGYRVAGKTGTAQRVDPDCGCYRGYTSSFAGFAPADDPQYVVVVSLMNPRNGNSGGKLAGPAFSDIMGFALEQGGVAPSGTEAPQVPPDPE